MAGQNRSSFNKDFVDDRSRNSQPRGYQQYANQTQEAPEPPYKIYVGNLPPDITQGDIAKIFETMKLNAKNIRLGKDRNNDTFLGYCYVEFDTVNELEIALGNNGLVLNDKIIRINIANRKVKNGSNNGKQFNNRSNYPRQGGPGGGPPTGNFNMPPPSHMNRGGFMGHNNYDQGRGQGGHGNFDRNQAEFGNRNQFNRNTPMNREYNQGQRSNYQSAEEEVPVDNDPNSQRKKLVLKPRSVVVAPRDSEDAQRSKIFGTGKPKDHTAS